LDVSPTYTLRGRLLLALALAFLPGLGLLIESQLAHRADLLEDQYDRLRLHAERHAHEIETDLRSSAALATALTQLPSLRGLDPAVCNPVLAALLPRFPRLGNLGVTDARGDSICSATPVAGPLNLGDRSWFRRVLASGQPAMGDYQVSRATGRAVLNFAAPIVAGQAIAGVAVVAVDLERTIGESIDDHVPADHTVLLLDDVGTVLLRRPAPPGLTGSTVADHPLFALITRADDNGTAATEGFDGVPRLVGYASVRAGDRQLRLAVTADQQQVTTAIEQMLLTRLAVIGIVTALLAALLWYGARRIVLQPLGLLAQAAERLGGGAPPASGAVPQDELARLAEQFDRLSHDIDARETRTRAALAAHQASEERLRNAIVQAPIPIILHAEDGEVLLLSDVWTTLSGYGHADLPNTAAWVELTHRGDPAAVHAGIRKLYQLTEPYDEGLFDIACRDGRRRIWHFRSAPLGRLHDGRRAVISMAVDVTQEQRQAQALRESEERFHNLADHAPIMLWVTDAEGRCTYLNPRWCELTGQALEHGLGVGWVEALHPDDRAAAYAAFLEAQARQAEFQIRYRLVDHAGGVHEAIDSAAPRLAADGSFLGYVGTVVDVSDLLAAERALRESERHYRQLFEANPHPMWVYDRDSLRFLAVNDAAIAHYGWSREEFLAMTIADIRPAADVPALLEKLAVARDGLDESGIWRHQTRAGDLLEVEIASHTLDFHGHRAKVVLAHDVTARRRAEAELQALNRELEQRVTERTANLAAVNRELETFTYTVSHDLKAPLRGIDGYSRLLADECAAVLDDDGRILLDHIRAGVGQMQQLIDDLLAYSRLERRALQAAPLELRGAVAQAVAEFRPQIEQHGVELTLDAPAAQVLADADGLAIALRNLLDNALKFSAGAAPPRIDIGGRVEATSTIMWVRDNGIGFDMRFHDRIFEIFQRLGRQETYPGTGIGLALVHKALQHMHGRVWAESQPGQGTTFYLELPNAA
jgi:PAS domain S-box-containing protein